MMTDTTAGPPNVDPFNVWLGLDVRPEGIPLALRMIEQWVVWKAEPRDNGKGMNKVPYQVTGVKASSTNPATWTDFQTAIGACQEEDSIFNGPGFTVRVENGIVVLDFDHVRHAHTGEIRHNVLEMVRYLGTYAEISPSGTGIRVIGYGTLDAAITSPMLQGWVQGRYVTITGHHLPETPNDLHLIDPEHLAAVVAWCAPTAQPAPTATAPFTPRPTFHLDPKQVLEVRQALGYIHPDEHYDLWVKVGMALHSTGAANAFGLWNEWSQLGAKYAPASMGAKWASFTDKLNGVSLSTIFALAQDRGWVNPASREAQAFERATGMTLEEANRRVPEPTLIEIHAPTVRAFPVGGLDEIADWITRTAPVSDPVLTQLAVLSLVSVAASRLYTTPQGDPLSLYLGACARSVGELRYLHHAVRTAMNAAGLRRMVRETRLTSPQMIYKTLLRSPAALYLSDDYGGVTAFSKRQPSGLLEHALALQASLYDGKTVQLDGPEDAGYRPGSAQVTDEQPVIYAPALSMLALIGSDHLASLMRASEAGRGALQQLLLGIGDERTLIIHDPQDLPPPAWLAGYLRQIRRAPHPAVGVDLSLADIFSNAAAEMPPRPVVVRFAAALEDIYAALDGLTDDRRVRSLLLAARAHVRRVAAGLAVWGNPEDPVVTAAIRDWTGDFVVARLTAMVEQFEILHSTDGKSSVYDQVLAKITEAKIDGLSNRELVIGCWGFRSLSAKQRGELLECLCMDQMIVEVDVVNPKTKRKSQVFVASKFVKQEG